MNQHKLDVEKQEWVTEKIRDGETGLWILLHVRLENLWMHLRPWFPYSRKGSEWSKTQTVPVVGRYFW